MSEENDFQQPPVTHSQKKGPLAGLSPVAFIFLTLAVVFFLYQIVGGAITYFLLGEDLKVQDENLNMVRMILSFAQFMFILFPAIMLVMLRGDNLKDTFRLQMPDTRVLLFSIVGILVIQPFLQVYIYYQNEIIFSIPFAGDFIEQLKELFDELESTTEKLVHANNLFELATVIIVIAVTPAICEEFLFRGLVFRNFEKFLSASKSIVLTGVLFALFHFHPFNLIPLGILGIFLTFIVYHSGSIYTAVIGHFLNNFISAYAFYLYGSDILDGDTPDRIPPDEQLQFIILGVSSLVVFIFCVFMIKKYSVVKLSKQTPADE